jgi:hypothetical protein
VDWKGREMRIQRGGKYCLFEIIIGKLYIDFFPHIENNFLGWDKTYYDGWYYLLGFGPILYISYGPV